MFCQIMEYYLIMLLKVTKHYKRSYFIQPILKEIIPDLEESYLNINYNFEGTKTIRNNFNLKSFPFDRQILNLSLYQSRYELGKSEIAPTDWTQRDLEIC